MTLTAGSRLGPYEIVAPIGAGGMGEVWRARDTRLERSVAIKILPAEFAQNVQLKLRFEREAKTISQLNHPHICTLYDVGDGYLVMELLEGESLADRLAKGPLPLEQVLRYGTEIAEALDRAHKAGVVHRDLKPGNIMLTKSGAKLLDFGLAKSSGAPFVSGATQKATEQKPLTAEGMILGTFQYMAPEQIEGREADARTDIFAFGTVLYEMVTGRRAFEGKTKTSLIAAIIERDPPPLSSIQPMTPPALDRLVRTCLAKDPDDRWQTAHDALLELRWIAEAAAATVRPARRARNVHAVWAVLCTTIAVGALFGGRAFFRTTLSRPPVIRSSILPPPKTTFSILGALGTAGGVAGGGTSGSFAIAPDASSLVFPALGPNGREVLWLRKLDAFDSVTLRETEGAYFPFYSPDGKFIGFFADGKLKRISVSGGAPQTICDAERARGGTWNRDGVIVFAATSRDPLSRVGGDGVLRPLTTFDGAAGEFSHRWPWFLPDGKHFLYLALASRQGKTTMNVFVGSLDSGDRKQLLSANSQAVYSQGYLLFGRDKVIMAQRFDPDRLELSGERIPVAEDVQTVQTTVIALFAASGNGVLAYLAGATEPNTKLAWFDRSGRQLGTVGSEGNYGTFRLSRDGTRVAIDSVDLRLGTEDIWVYDLTRAVSTRLTFGPTWNSSPTWSADGRHVLYRTTRTGPVDIYRRDAAGAASEQLVIHSDPIKFAGDESPDGRSLVFYELDPKKKTGFDLWIHSVDGSPDQPFLQGPFNQTDPAIMPDGRALAYVSDESGRNEIYLTSFPVPGTKLQVSTGGGLLPRWRRDGQELYFLSSDFTINAVPMKDGAPAAPPAPLFKIATTVAGTSYDVAPRGDRFLVTVPIEAKGTATISVVSNWTSALPAQ